MKNASNIRAPKAAPAKPAPHRRQDEAEMYRTLVERANEAIFIIHRTGKVLFVNRAGARLQGKAPRQLIGQSLWKMFPPALIRRYRSNLNQSLQSGRRLTVVEQAVLLGKWRWYQSTIQPLGDPITGKLDRALVAAQDITDLREAELAARQAEQSLRERENHISRILEASRDAIYRLDLKTFQHDYLSPAGREVFGFNLQDIMQLSPDEFLARVHPDDRQIFSTMPAFTRKTRKKEILPPLQPLQYRFRTEAGEYRWLSTTRAVQRDAKGEAIAIIGTIRDITEQKQAEQALRDSERHIRGILEASRDVIYRLDMRTLQYDFMSSACRDVLGYSLNEINALGHRYMLTRVHPDDRRLVAPITPSADGHLDGESPALLEPAQYRFKTKAGHLRWLSVSRAVQRNAEGKPVAIIGTIRDITEQKEAEIELAQREANYRTLVENTIEPIFTVRHDGRILFANAAAAGSDIVPGLSVGQNLWKLFPEPMRRRYRSYLAQALRSGQRLTFVDKARPDAWYWFKATIQPLANPATGKLDRAMVLGQDITELREAELAARQAQHQGMMVRDQERKRLAADLHDSLGQGLVLLRLKLQRVLQDSAAILDKAHRRELAGTIRTCGLLVQEVRSLCHGLYPAALESLGLPAALRGLARDFAGSADVSTRCPKALEDERLGGELEIALFRIAQEALQNAVRHGRARHVRILLHRHNHLVEMRVRDDGMGFDAKAASKGMGLHVMAERARSLGGNLTVRSSSGNTEIVAAIPVNSHESKVDSNGLHVTGKQRTQRSQRTQRTQRTTRESKGKRRNT